MAIKEVLLFLSLIFWISALQLPKWSQFKDLYEKNYSCPEEEHKSAYSFFWNSRAFGIHAERISSDQVKHWLEINSFADTEFGSFMESKPYPSLKNYIQVLDSSKVNKVVPYQPRNTPLPPSFFWRIPYLNYDRLYNPSGCFAGWALAAASAVQSQIFLLRFKTHLEIRSKKGSQTGNKTGSLILREADFPSAQQLIDCSDLYGNLGCAGGSVLNALRFIADNGITSDTKYPYTGTDGLCNVPTGMNKISSILAIESGNETELQDALVNVGPIAVTIRLPVFHFLSFYKGILGFPSCPSVGRNVAALLMGYGNQSGVSYWALQSFFGPSWGETGYFRIRRGSNDNFCGIASEAFVPLLFD